MSSQQASDPSAAGAGPAERGIAGYSHDLLQNLVDQAAWAHVYAVPERKTSGAVRAADGKAVIGIRHSQPLHRFDIDMQPITAADGVRAVNTVGQVAGRLDLRWMFVPYDHVARPDAEPPATALDKKQSQRFAMQEMAFTFGQGSDGFRCFGTGRTFPNMSGGRLQVVVDAVGMILEGSGRFQGVQGNFTLCGELTDDHAFLGHIMIRLVDPDGRLRTRDPLPPIAEAADPEPGVTFLTWIAQKGDGPDQENYWSFTPAGDVRGANIPVAIWRPHVDFSADGAGFRARELEIGKVIAREVGFGRETRPRTADNGTILDPYQFEGVSEYTFYDAAGQPVGACSAVFLEGRSIAMQLPGAPGAPALRFGYFGAFVGGKGCFEGVRGMLYGAAGSVFAPPPADHVITNLYVARIQDPARRFRAKAKR